MSKKSKFNPKETLSIAKTAKNKLLEFYVRLRNVPGALSETSEIFSRYNVNILIGEHFVKDSEGYWIFFADFSNAVDKPEIIAERVKANPKVLEVKYVKSEKNIIIEEFLYPVTSWGWRLLLFNANRLKHSFKTLMEEFGSGISTMIFYQGFLYGVEITRWLKDITKSIEITRREILELIIKLYRSHGFGIAELEEYNLKNRIIKIKVEDSFETFKEKMKTSTCQFSRGFWSGVISEIFKTKMKADEVKCVSKGDDFCEFYIREWR
ncbi:MAG: hypothetical protein DRJ30_00625 [Candidatus Methanomethylicota archaeon]|nr:MAG: hypothetical protein DRJ30_00625 [Candidatus Verstraetearchaeota archaeon]